MAKVIDYTFGKLTSATKKETGKKYTDWRAEYYDWPGLIVVGESEKKRPGSRFIYIYLNSPDSFEQPYFHTSMGEYKKDGKIITIETNNSIYEFEEGDFDITESQKMELILNCIG